MKLVLRVSYDGSAYHGFQYQPNGLTVQQVLTETVSRVMGFSCSVTGCSRTDAGVHAIGFCASVEPRVPTGETLGNWCPIPLARVPAALNASLPRDISVTGGAMCPDSFHPRYSVVSKEYKYLLHDGKYPSPFMRAYSYRLKHPLTDLSISKMNEAARPLLGKHDFSSFMASGSSVETTVRRLMRLEVVREMDDVVAVYARADGFLYNMVRILTGTLLEVAEGKLAPGDTADILASCDRERAGRTAPACGLYLLSVDYAGAVIFD